MVSPQGGVSGGRPFARGQAGSARLTAPATMLSAAAPSVIALPAPALSPTQVQAIRSAMKLFVDDDLARGVRLTDRMYCDACQRARPAAGVIRYGRYAVCNGCAMEYEVARAQGQIASPGQYVRDKRFGEGDSYLLPD